MRQLQACKTQSSELQADLGTCQDQNAELQRPDESELLVDAGLFIACASQTTD